MVRFIDVPGFKDDGIRSQIIEPPSLALGDGFRGNLVDLLQVRGFQVLKVADFTGGGIKHEIAEAAHKPSSGNSTRQYHKAEDNRRTSIHYAAKKDNYP